MSSANILAARRQLRAAAAVAGAALLALCAPAAQAAEGGASFYLLGQRSLGAAEVPPEGLFFTAPNYFYSGDAAGSRNIAFGGSLAAGIDTDLYISMPTAIWMTPVEILGGRLGFTGTLVVGYADVAANATLSIPALGAAQASTEDSRWALGDPVVGALMGWQAGDFGFQLATSVNLPVGDYEAGRLANISLNRWALDVTGAATWLDPDLGIEISGALGTTFNGENDATDYETGTELHVEAAVGYHITPQIALGVNGYHYQQVTGDSGAGATLGDFEGRVSGIGPVLDGSVMLGPLPVFARLQYYHEFNAKNRLEGDAGWLTLTIPLWVPDSGGSR